MPDSPASPRANRSGIPLKSGSRSFSCDGSRDGIARPPERLVVSPNTISNWEASADYDSGTAGSLVKPNPPVRRLADTARSVIKTLALARLGGSYTITKAAWKISERTVGRIRAEVHIPAPIDVYPARASRPVITRFVGHTWMLDASPFHTLGNSGDLWLAGVYDAHSRAPLVLSTCESPPTASKMAMLFKVALVRFHKPKYVITDHGPEFKGAFARTVRKAGCEHRRASRDNKHANARLERFWRTLEALTAYRVSYPASIEDLEARLETALAFYLRTPHKGLQAATPIETFLGQAPEWARRAAPRGGKGVGPRAAAVQILFLDPALRRFPLLASAF